MQYCLSNKQRNDVVIEHFRNALKCKQHDHGVLKASCGVDALAEVYYYGVYQFDPECQITGKNPLFVRLLQMCEMRDLLGPSCEIREELWEWLSSNVAGYKPKGRSDAEILQAFERFSDESNKFCVRYNGYGSCTLCSNQFPVQATIDPVISLDQTIVSKQKGDLASSLETIIERAIHNKCKAACACCSVPLCRANERQFYEMPNFLVVTIGLNKDGKNMQQPGVTVDECITIRGTQFTLTAAVQMKPGHFYSVVKVNEEFAIIDDLREDVIFFNTFDDAVTRRDPKLIPNQSMNKAKNEVPTYADSVRKKTFHQPSQCLAQNRSTTLSSNNDGVHIIVYAKYNAMANFQDEKSSALYGNSGEWLYPSKFTERGF